jgi:hypothetical protein
MKSLTGVVVLRTLAAAILFGGMTAGADDTPTGLQLRSCFSNRGS